MVPGTRLYKVPYHTCSSNLYDDFILESLHIYRTCTYFKKKRNVKSTNSTTNTYVRLFGDAYLDYYWCYRSTVLKYLKNDIYNNFQNRQYILYNCTVN